MIARLSRFRRFVVVALLLCLFGAEARAQHVLTPEEANKLTFDALTSGGGGGGGGSVAPRRGWHRSYGGGARHRWHGGRQQYRGRAGHAPPKRYAAPHAHGKAPAPRREGAIVPSHANRLPVVRQHHQAPGPRYGHPAPKHR